MPNADDILWFKQQFRDEVEAAVGESPFDLDMLTALACQETGEIWPMLQRKGLPRQHVLKLCAGDTLDSSKGRKAFPKTKSDLVAVPDGERMFDIAREALVDMAQYIPSYKSAAANPNKFCHGFGIFQYDLQFFLTDPEYFLEKRYEGLSQSLGKALDELLYAVKTLGWDDKTNFGF